MSAIFLVSLDLSSTPVGILFQAKNIQYENSGKIELIFSCDIMSNRDTLLPLYVEQRPFVSLTLNINLIQSQNMVGPWIVSHAKKGHKDSAGFDSNSWYI